MKKFLLCGVMCIATTPAIAETIFVDAPVVSVNQLYKASEVRTPVQNCSQQLVPYRQANQDFGIGNIIGGVVGGLLGNQVGKGRGKTAATALGAVGGVMLGGRLNQRATTHYEQKTVCTTSYNIQHNQIPDGYMVTYKFGGQQYQTKTYYRPSSTIKLRVTTNHRVSQ